MKTKTILVSMLAIAALAGCNKEKGEPVGKPDRGNTEVAYLSIRIDAQKRALSRSSDEEDAEPEESAVNTLYIVTFNDTGDIVEIPGGDYFIKLTGTPVETSPDAFKVSAATTRLLIVANPGAILKSVLELLNSTSHFSTLNAAIRYAAVSEIVDMTAGFTMINSGDETGKTVGDQITLCLIPVTADNIKKPSDYTGDNAEQQAIDDAQTAANRVKVRIERLASKVQFTSKDDNALTVKPTGATFTFGNWTIDALNTTFFPWAVKNILGVAHTTTDGFYVRNFYTEDPNFSGTAARVGIQCAAVDDATYLPQFPHSYGWMDKDAVVYTIENTMDANDQKIGNATSIVIKGIFTPDGYTQGNDWFSYAGVYYSSLAALQTAYLNPASQNLRTACDDMFEKIKGFLTAQSEDVAHLDLFNDLTEADLNKVVGAGGEYIGGELLKQNKPKTDPVIRWYQKGQCYYYYKIRHDNETTVEMAFGKYGVVRNNWYSLTLNSLNGPGTPWYPDINEPGPGDPDPTDPIDKASGYLGITVEVGPWVFWETEVNI